MTCHYCHRELVSQTAYEDGIYATIGQWLCDVTCIPWYRFAPDFAKPDGQYGMMFISGYRQSRQKLETRQAGADLDTADLCLSVEELLEIDLDLHVFREHGGATKCDHEAFNDTSRSTLSAVDVLKKVNSLSQIKDFNELLRDNEIVFKMADSISVKLNQRLKKWEYWAESTHSVSICRRTSYPLNGDDLVYCVELCDGTPICRAVDHPDCPE